MSYGAVAKTLHWTVVCLLLVQFPLAWTIPRILPGQPPDSLARLHLSVGLSMLAVMALRLAWRLTHRPPPLPDDLPRWQRLASRFVHDLLYAALLATPVAGWLWASSKDWPIAFFGTIALPPLIGAGSPLAHMAARAHQWLAWAILALVGLHILAVLYHAVIRRDDVALRMLPR